MTLTDSRQDVLECLVLNGGIDLSRAQRTVQTEEIGNKARDMWCGHRSPREALGRTIVESRDDIEARSPNVDTGAKVREGGLGVGDGRGTDGDSFPDPSGGGADSVLVVISGSNDNGDSGVKEL